jgi:hypothetical protein
VADVTYLDSQPLAKDSGPGSEGRPGTGPAGPAIPATGALTAHRPLGGPGAVLTAGLLGDWQRRNRDASLPLALRQLEAAGNLANVRAAAEAAQSAGTPGQVRSRAVNRAADSVHPATAAEGASAAEASDAADAADAAPPGGAPSGHRYHGPVFMDSDIHKTLEAIGWELARDPGSTAARALATFAADAVSLLEQAQEPDGYLDSYVQVSGEPRYSRLASSHELYCAGHLIQAAVAMARTAGDNPAAGRLMAVARRLADHLVATFLGREAGLDGHPVIETALAELYRQTGARDYLALATQFVDQRGHGLAGDSGRGHRYLQDQIPIRETVTEEGHAVRALYLEAGVVDVATETGDAELLASSIARWEDMVATKTYLTGGNGSRHSDESFGDRYELPPDRAYNETCAAIASFQWSWRLLLATGQSRYADLMERVLYNAFGASVSTDGQRFFYVNPLQRRADHFEGDDPGRRHEWFSCACCPPNIMRLLASLQHYLATIAGDTLYLHQFTGAELNVPLAGGTLAIAVSAGLPWSGEVTVQVTGAPEAECGLAVRVPSWSREPHLRVNGEHVPATRAEEGYLIVTRAWRAGDVLSWTFGLAARWVFPHPRIDAVRGCAAIERGPLVYCLEQADQEAGSDLANLALLSGTPLAERPATRPGIGRTVLVDARAVPVVPGEAEGPTAEGRRAEGPKADGPAGLPYLGERPGGLGTGGTVGFTATAVPYFQWDNRDGRAMRVWLPAASKTG